MLATKIARAEAGVDNALERYGQNGFAVAFSGGKDSTVALWIVVNRLRKLGVDDPAVICLDTGLKFPEVNACRDKILADWGLSATIAAPEIAPEGRVSEDRVECCSWLKIEPLKRTIRELGVRVLFDGLRADEHPSRANRPAVELRRDPDYIAMHPILAFTELDVWTVIAEHGLPYCALYDQGHRSLGCKPCTALGDPSSGEDERSGRDAEKEKMLGALRDLGYF